MAAPPSTAELGAGISLFRDTCNVYVLRSGRDAVLVDFGAGDVLDHLDELDVDRVTDILVTHHHRDQVQGLARAVEAGIRVWVPALERHLVEGVDERWRTRQLDNDYDLREDRFSLLDGVPVTGTIDDYRTRRFGDHDVYALPTPGHTLGSVTYLVEAGGRRLAFCGDLVYGDGKLWSLAATQWSYSGVTGQAATILSCAILAEREPDVLLPSHGEPIDDPQAALSLTADRLQELLDLRLPEPSDVRERHRRPYEPVTPHLLRNRTTFGNSYALLSESGAALVVDFGYDVATSLEATEFGARRTLLWSIDALRRDHSVKRVEAAVVTHFHDDHVGGLNLLRDVQGTEVWAPENVAPVLEEPRRYDLPCLWFHPIPVDRTLPLGMPVTWHEYELTAYALPGHTLYAAAILVEVDGRRVLATGDQQTNDGGRSILNYQYRNRFRAHDYLRTVELYRELRPDVLIGGHWLPLEVTDEWLERLAADAERVAELHEELLPEDGLGTEGFCARIVPYRATVAAGSEVELEVEVRNPFAHDDVATVALAVPAGWEATPPVHELELGAHGVAVARFRVRVGAPVRRARVAADVTVGTSRFGQQAEAVVDVE